MFVDGDVGADGPCSIYDEISTGPPFIIVAFGSDVACWDWVSLCRQPPQQPGGHGDNFTGEFGRFHRVDTDLPDPRLDVGGFRVGCEPYRLERREERVRSLRAV